jgi:hypothetical protein
MLAKTLDCNATIVIQYHLLLLYTQLYGWNVYNVI